MQAEAPLCGPGNRGRSTTNLTPHTCARVRCDSDHHTDATSSLYLATNSLSTSLLHPSAPPSLFRSSPFTPRLRSKGRLSSSVSLPPLSSLFSIHNSPQRIRSRSRSRTTLNPLQPASRCPYLPIQAPRRAGTVSISTHLRLFCAITHTRSPNLRKLSHDQYSSRLSLYILSYLNVLPEPCCQNGEFVSPDQSQLSLVDHCPILLHLARPYNAARHGHPLCARASRCLVSMSTPSESTA